jgi:hypothetical protein
MKLATFYFLVFNKGTAEEEIIPLRFHKGFNPDAHRPKSRVVVQQMLEGVNIQDSGVIHGGQTITMSGVEFTDEDIAKLSMHYEAGDRKPFIYRDTRKEAPEEWPVVWAANGLQYKPYMASVPGINYDWTITLVTLGKYAPDGTVLP